MTIEVYNFEDGKRCGVGDKSDYTICGDAPEEDINGSRQFQLVAGTINCPDCIQHIELVKSLRRWKARSKPEVMNMAQKFKTISDGLGGKAGTVCYKLSGYDYGLASDDTRMTGIEHVSMTLDPNGGYPSFTVPLEDLEEFQIEIDVL